MNIKNIYAAPLYFVSLITLAACSGGNGVSNVDVSFSDAAVDEASEVVITVESITFRQNSEDETGDIVVDTFGGEETFTLDLLTVQGTDKELVIDSVELPVGEYSNMLIEVVPDSAAANYVVDANGTKELKVPSNELKLGAFSISPTSTQSMVVEFGLQQSMTYNPGEDRYILKPRGVRIVTVAEAALVTGTIDHAALQADASCTALEMGGTAGNVYLYSGHGIEAGKLGDNFDPETATNDNSLVEPLASASLKDGAIALSYLEAGDYTLAVSCHDESDDADLLQALVVPNPADQAIEFSIAEGQTFDCAIPLTAAGCVEVIATTEEPAEEEAESEITVEEEATPGPAAEVSDSEAAE